ncbi:MAG: polyphosphate polymerase domain-containing protein [Ruminococcaceae bacterium]|nr:polyphosphate polymerase domain-containing protein [Oscillospiraceae bacterium]
MAFQSVFKRYEIKYMLTLEQKEKIVAAMQEYMSLDKYGRSSIRNIYFDTDSYRLIRRSIDKPTYKEKLRIRSYGQATQDSKVFVELKKKYDGIVYKRRLDLPCNTAFDWVNGKITAPSDTQISREIQYFLKYYDTLKPKAFLSYEREAYYEKSGGNFRVTFDDNIIFRTEDLSLTSDLYGEPLLEDGKVLMELKCSGGIPLWLVRILSKEKIYKTSFSKYGTGYTRFILPELNKKIFTTQEKQHANYN